MNAAGQVAGSATRYSGLTVAGYDAWVYSPATGTTVAVGPGNPTYQENDVGGLGDNGLVAGTSEAWVGTGNPYGTLGTVAWAYIPSLGRTLTIGTNTAGTVNNRVVAVSPCGLVIGDSQGSTTCTAWVFAAGAGPAVAVGPTDPAHTSPTTGGSYEVPEAVGPTGQVAGYAYRYGTGGTVVGYDAWVTAPSPGAATGATVGAATVVGLYDAAHANAAGGSFDYAKAVNAAGQVAGYASRYAGTTTVGQDAWLYSPATATTVLVGLTDAAHTQSAGTGAGTVNDTPQYLNALGELAGYATRYAGSSTEGQDPWVYDARTGVTYDLLASQSPTGYAFGEVNALSDDGTAIGTYDKYAAGTATYVQHAFRWSEAAGFVDLGTLVPGGLTAAGWSALADATAINAGGQIVGSGPALGTATPYQPFVLTPTPEPAAVALLPVAAALLLGRRRRPAWPR